MNNWDFFGAILNQLQPPVQAAVDQISAALIAWVHPLFIAGIGALIAGRMIQGALTPQSAEPVGMFMRHLITAGIIYSIVASTATYNYWVRDLFLNDLPNELGQRVASAGGFQTINATAFSELWDKAYAAGLAVEKNISTFAIGFHIVVVVYWGAAAFAIAIACIVWFAGYVFLSLAIAVGPLFLPLFAFPLLSRAFSGWLAATLTCIVLQLLSVALLAMLILAENKVISQLGATTSAIGGIKAGNEAMQIMTLFGGIVLFGFLLFLSKQLPNAAQHLVGGVYLHTNSLVGQAQSHMSAASTFAGGVAGRLLGYGSNPGSGRGGGTPGSASSFASSGRRPVGPSLSRRSP